MLELAGWLLDMCWLFLTRILFRTLWPCIDFPYGLSVCLDQIRRWSSLKISQSVFFIFPVSECKWFSRMPQMKAGTWRKQRLEPEPFTFVYFESGVCSIPHATSMYPTVLCAPGTLASLAPGHPQWPHSSFKANAGATQTCKWPALANGWQWFSFAAWIHAKPSPKISKRNTHLGSLRFSPFRLWFGNLRSTPFFPPYPMSLIAQGACFHTPITIAEPRFWQRMASADIVNWKLCCKWWSLS